MVAGGEELGFGVGEGFDDVGVEVGAGLGQDHLAGHVMGEGGFVNAAGSERVVHIGQGDDAAAEGNFFSDQFAGIAFAVESFMVRGGNVARPIFRNSTSGNSPSAASSVCAPMVVCVFMISNSRSLRRPACRWRKVRLLGWRRKPMNSGTR